MANKHIVVLLIVFSVLSCNTRSTEEKQEENTTSIDSIKPAAQATVIEEHDEYLDWRSVRINAKVPLATTVQNFERILGKADSVNSINWEVTCSSTFRSEDSKLAYYRGYEFEHFGDSLYFQSVTFGQNKDLFLQSNDIKLNSSTTMEEVKKLFPNAAKNVSKMDVYKIGEVDAIALPRSKTLSDRHWLLMFQTGKLIRIDDWSPC